MTDTVVFPPITQKRWAPRPMTWLQASFQALPCNRQLPLLSSEPPEVSAEIQTLPRRFQLAQDPGPVSSWDSARAALKQNPEPRKALPWRSDRIMPTLCLWLACLLPCLWPLDLMPRRKGPSLPQSSAMTFGLVVLQLGKHGHGAGRRQPCFNTVGQLGWNMFQTLEEVSCPDPAGALVGNAVPRQPGNQSLAE